MKVLAIDFETANGNLASVCAVGISIMEDGVIINRWGTLVKPPIECDYFLWGNVNIHHISQEMVANQPEWPTIYQKIAPWFHDAIVVAHNAPFDMAVLRAVNASYGIEMDDFSYFCTVELSRIIHPYLPNHKLNTVSEYLEVDLQHHEATSDAFACLSIVMEAMRKTNIYDIEKLCEELMIRRKQFLQMGTYASQKKQKRKRDK